MRLGQLARKLAVRPDQIVEFLAKKNIHIEDGSNTRLDDDSVALLIKKFAPAGFELTPSEVQVQEIQEIVEPTEQLTAQVEITHIDVIADETPIQELVRAELPSEDKIEIIKAPKVELSGLKVLGKIELPEQKKKEQQPPEVVSGNSTADETKPRERRKPLQNRQPRTSRPAQNPIALQREREEQEAERKREAAKAMEKEKKAQHYFNKVKVVTPVKATKREQVAEEFAEPVPQPKTLLGKFFRWFRS